MSQGVDRIKARIGAFATFYFAVLTGVLLLVGGGIFVIWSGYPVIGGVMIAIFLVLLPGRILRYFWRDLLAGLGHLDQGNYALSKQHSERFLTQVREKPRLRKMMWPSMPEYSRDSEALACNALGAAMQHLGEIEPAREQISRAIALDPEWALPHRTMGMLVLKSASYAEALPWFEKATALGLKGDWIQDLMAAPRDRPRGAFRVELIRDDVTPFECIVSSLEQVFDLTGAEAVRIATFANRNGRAACAGFESETAAQAKADELLVPTRAGVFPLSCAVIAVRSALG